MKALLAAVLLAAAPLAAQDRPEPYGATPEQFPGQLARLRLQLLYPKPAAEKTRAAGERPSAAAFLSDSAPVLKNVRGLAAYLREGLRNPRAAEGSREWPEAWKRLDAELGRLRPLAAEGEALLGAAAPAAARPAEDAPELNSSDGRRVRRALDLAARTEELRELLARKSAETAAERARASAQASLP